MSDSPIAVVGGGIVGGSVAYHLSERTDTPITVYERGELAAETTAMATAMIGVAGADPYYRMKEYGFRLYNDFFAEPAAETQYRQAGRLRVATSSEGAREVEDAAAGRPGDDTPEVPAPLGGDKFANSIVDYVPGDALTERFILPPLATERIEGALYRPQYGYISSDTRTLGAQELAMEFIERARDNGVSVEIGTEITDLVVENGRVTGVERDGSDVDPVDAVVLAAGPWNARLAECAGLELPVGHLRSPVYALELTEPLAYSLPMIKAHESTVGIHPKRPDTVLVTYRPDDPSGLQLYDPENDGEGVLAEHRDTTLETARELLPILEDATLVDEWLGLGTTTPDGRPIVGWSPIGDLSLAVTMAGIQYAPAVGSIVARQMVDDDPTEYYDAVSISRFEEYTDSRQDE